MMKVWSIGATIAVLFFASVSACFAADLPVKARSPCSGENNIQDQTDCFISRAIAANQVTQLKRLLRSPYADPNRAARWCGGLTYYGCAARSGASPAVYEALAEAGGDPNTHVRNKPVIFFVNSYLTEHRLNNGAEIYSILLSHGLNPSIETDAHEPLIVSAAYDCVVNEPVTDKIVKMLLGAGASFESETVDGISAMHWLAFAAPPKCITSILDRNGFSSVKRSDWIAKGIYTDAAGFTIMDYAISMVHEKSNPPHVCWRTPDGKYFPWYFARWLASKDVAFANELRSKRVNTWFNCSIRKYVRGPAFRHHVLR